MSDQPHHCHATGCEIPVPPRMLMCKRHWLWVHPLLRKEVFRTYRPGQCDDKQPSEEWRTAAFAAVGYVALREGRTPSAAQLQAVGRYRLIGPDGNVVL